jgi:hypothetical protein
MKDTSHCIPHAVMIHITTEIHAKYVCYTVTEQYIFLVLFPFFVFPVDH